MRDLLDETCTLSGRALLTPEADGTGVRGGAAVEWQVRRGKTR